MVSATFHFRILINLLHNAKQELPFFNFSSLDNKCCIKLSRLIAVPCDGAFNFMGKNSVEIKYGNYQATKLNAQ